jgi:hypothetical protein
MVSMALALAMQLRRKKCDMTGYGYTFKKSAFYRRPPKHPRTKTTRDEKSNHGNAKSSNLAPKPNQIRQNASAEERINHGKRRHKELNYSKLGGSCSAISSRR